MDNHEGRGEDRDGQQYTLGGPRWVSTSQPDLTAGYRAFDKTGSYTIISWMGKIIRTFLLFLAIHLVLINSQYF
jgi:hypothetical protein